MGVVLTLEIRLTIYVPDEIASVVYTVSASIVDILPLTPVPVGDVNVVVVGDEAIGNIDVPRALGAFEDINLRS